MQTERGEKATRVGWSLPQPTGGSLVMTRNPISPGPAFLHFSLYMNAIYMYIRELRRCHFVAVYLAEDRFDWHCLRETLETVISAPGSRPETGRACLRRRVK